MIFKIYRIQKKEKCKLFTFQVKTYEDLKTLIKILSKHEGMDKLNNYSYEVETLKNGVFQNVFYSITRDKNYPYTEDDYCIIMNGGEPLKREENDLYFGGNLVLKKTNDNIKCISQSHSMSVYDTDDYGCCKIQENGNVIEKKSGSDCCTIPNNCKQEKLYNILLNIDDINSLEELRKYI